MKRFISSFAIFMLLFGIVSPTFANENATTIDSSHNISYEEFILNGNIITLEKEEQNNGNIKAVLTEEGQTTNIDFFPATNETFINGEKLQHLKLIKKRFPLVQTIISHTAAVA